MSINVAIVGATGAAGAECARLLADSRLPLGRVRLLASAKSAGKLRATPFGTLPVEEARPEAFAGLHAAIFATEGAVSKALAPAAIAAGCVVVDKSSAFRQRPEVPLVIPEINPEALEGHRGLVANPNCSTAVMLMGLWPLHLAFGVKRVLAATYQSVSGTGVEAVEELAAQIRASVAGEPLPRRVYPHQIAFNVLPHVDAFGADGYTGEETKMALETRKITGLPDLRISATCVRVPVVRAHSVAVQAEFDRPVDLAAARAAIAAFAGAELVDDPAANAYPTPLAFSGKVRCGVGRLRRDAALDNGLAFWVSGDNLWKGAALNAIQVTEALWERGLLRVPADSRRG